MRRRSLLLGGLGALCLGGPARAWQVHDVALFGSPVRLQLPRAAPAREVRAVLAGLHRLHVGWNAWKPGGLGSLNDALREGRPITPSPALGAVLRGAVRLERLSGGHFNPAIGRLVGAWGFHADRPRDGAPPPPAELAQWRHAVPSLASLVWDGAQLRSRDPRVQLDLGGYAKGVALDWALDRLQAAGVQDALLDLGGNLAVRGAQGARAWRIGIRDPHGSGLLASLSVHGREAVVSSGVYERSRVHDGQRLGHVIDPRTARPTASLQGVTVVHRDAALADAAATALLVAGPMRWRSVAASMAVDQALVVQADGSCQATPALARRLSFARPG